MKVRSPSRRAIGALQFAVVAVLLPITALSTAAQQQPLRGSQSPGPRFLLPTLASDGSALGFQVANAVRERIASEFDMRTLWVVPESTIAQGLKNSGYRVDQALSPSENRQLSQMFRADEALNGAVFKTPSGAYRVEADWSLTRRDDMVQPLPPVEAAKISDVAKLVAREFNAARRQVEGVRRCNDLARVRNFAGAIAAARKAIEAYPNSVLGRVCIANVYAQEKAAPDSMIRISEEILAIHPRNLRALGFAADAFEAKGSVEDLVRVLRQLARVDSANGDVRLRLARVLARATRTQEALLVIDSLVAREPENADALQLQWLVHLSAKDWTGALRIGETLIARDPAVATRDFFIRMVAAADAVGDATKAAELATRGASKFPTDDELAMLNVQFLRRAGKMSEALAAVNALVARNPRVPNAWLQKARLEADLRFAADSVMATLRQAQENGEDPAAVSRLALNIGQGAGRDSTATSRLDPLRVAIRYYKFAESVHATDTTAYVLGATSASFGQLAANEARAGRQCDVAKEAQAALIDAQISLPKAGASFREQVPRILVHVAPLIPYSDQLVKAFCR